MSTTNTQLTRKQLLGRLQMLISASALPGGARFLGIPLEHILEDIVTYLKQRSSEKGYMVSVEGCAAPKCVHPGFTAASLEADRLAVLNPNKKVSVLAVVKQVKGTVQVKEIE